MKSINRPFFTKAILLAVLVGLLACKKNSDDIAQHPPVIHVTTLAGPGNGPGDDGPASSARFDNPLAVAVAADGTVYVADDYRVRKISTSGIVSTLAGSTSQHFGYADGPGSSAMFRELRGIAVAADGTIYVTDAGNYCIRKITPSGTVSTLAGSSTCDGYVDGVGSAARFVSLSGIAVARDGIIYAIDRANGTIRKVTPTGVVTTVAGGTRGYVDGPASDARFDAPIGIAVAADNTLYVADLGNEKIRKISPSGIVSTLAGSEAGYADGNGSSAKFYYPTGVVAISNGNVFVTDEDNNRIRQITPKGEVTTLAGGEPGFADGVGAQAKFYDPTAIAIDQKGSLYIVDNTNKRIRKITFD